MMWDLRSARVDLKGILSVSPCQITLCSVPYLWLYLVRARCRSLVKLRKYLSGRLYTGGYVLSPLETTR